MDEKDIVNASNMSDYLSDLKPVAYARKSLSDAETCYANIERELLWVVFGVEHFKHFTYGHHTDIITDHKPLLPLYLRNLSIIQPLIYHGCCYTFQSMTWNYIISLAPRWNLMMYCQYNFHTTQKTVTTLMTKVLIFLYMH